MKKLLTISVASYNVEQFLEKTLESCVIPEILDDIEVLIENDGSTDRTAEIAHAYELKYPGSFRLINKENGGYGTTVNRSMQEASGKYFKLLDGDDWFDKDGLLELISFLKTSDSDLILNRFYYVKDGTWEATICDAFWEKYEGATLPLKEIDCELPIGIWNTTVKTELIRKSSYLLPEHTLYTDQLFIIRFLPYISNITFSKTPVYCYRIGRDGQSVTTEARIKHYKEMLFVFREGLQLYADSSNSDEFNRRVLCSRNGMYYYRAVCTLLLMKGSREHFKELSDLRDFCRKNAEDVYQNAVRTSKKIKLLHYTNLLAYWFLAGRQENW